MMRTAFKKTSILIALAAPACIAAPASADTTGGVVSSPTASPSAPRAPRKGTVATWFGPGFYGQRTACGQMLTPSLLGVANRTLPCGTLVSITYRRRRLTLPVIDRGPYANGAQWDLTFGAARALGMADTARIAARVVGATRNTPALGAPPAGPLGAPPAVPVTASTGGLSAG
jgi:rare lipoprotein A (peptidoglycan hydrolase)